MPALTWAVQHRFWMLGIGLVVVVAVVAAGVWFFVLRSPGTKVDLSQALRLYRRDQRPEHSGKDADLPPPGVYHYRSSGGEQLSFGGISRTFPSSSDMIVTEGTCATMEWEPLEQHMEGLVECPQHGAFSIKAVLSDEQIAGTQTNSVISCPANTYFIPPDPVPGKKWRKTCHAPHQRVVISGQVLGTTSVAVGGRAVPALHTHITLTFSGAESGTNPNDYWVSLRNGLILRQRETVAVSQQAGPLGSVRYTEQMAIALTSTAPIR